MHTSCSAPLVPGERFGSLELLSLLTDDGEQCGDPCPDPGIKSEAIQCIEDQAIFSLTNPDFVLIIFGLLAKDLHHLVSQELILHL